MRYLRWIYRKSDTVIAPSKYIKGILRRKLGLKNDIIVIPSGIELDRHVVRIPKRSARKKLGIGQDEKVIMYLGRVSWEKNLSFLVKAAKALETEGFKLIIAGNGPYLEECRRLSEKYGIKNISFPGFIPDDLTNYYYAAADIFCNPSLFETQSLVDVEAMARGLPILVPEKTAQEEFLIAGKCGEAYDGKSEKDLVQKAVRMYRNKDRYSTYKVADEYSARNTAEKIESLYYSLVSG